MRKSDRLRIAELEIVRLSYEIEYLTTAIAFLLENAGVNKQPDLDAGKWYNRKPDRND